MANEIPSVGRFGPAHGNAKDHGAEVVFESHPDGVRPAAPVDPVPQAPRNRGQFTPASAREAARRRHELEKAPDYIRRELEFTPQEEFAPFDTGRRELLDRKAAELVRMTGGDVGSGVLTVVRGYSWIIAFAEYYAVRAARTGSDEDADRARRFFKDASIELGKAHELARAEAAARPANPAERWLRPKSEAKP